MVASNLLGQQLGLCLLSVAAVGAETGDDGVEVPARSVTKPQGRHAVVHQLG